MTEERRPGVGEGIRTGIGILSALKEAIEETLQEAIDRGDLSQERAKATMKEAVQRVQVSLDEARERLDVVPRREFDELRSEVDGLKRRLDRLEAPGPDDVSGPAGGSMQVD